MGRHTERDDHPFENRRDRDLRDDHHPRKRRRWPWVILLLLGVVFFLPNVIAMTSLKQQAIDYALADFRGHVCVESASMGWLQPITLDNIQVTDQQSQPIATIAQVKTSRSLMSFLMSSDYGSVDITQPSVWVQLHPNGSNLEDACAAWLSSSEAENPAPVTADEGNGGSVRLPKLRVNVTEGTVAIFSTDDNSRSWQVERLNLQASTSDDLAAIIADTACQITTYRTAPGAQPVAEQSGTLTLSAQVDPNSPVLTCQTLTSSVQTNAIPLSVIGPLIQRFMGPTETDGLLTVDLQAAYDATDHQMQVVIKQADAANVRVQAPSLIGADELKITSIRAAGNLALTPAFVTADQFQMVSDVAQVSANGTLDLNHLANLASSNTANNVQLLDTPFQLTGEIDLAGVAAVLPATLHLHDGLKIESGTVNIQAASRVENEIRRLIVNLDTANLVARDRGKPVVWQKPLRVVGTIRENGTGLMLEEVLCESDFLRVSGTATAESGSFAAEGNLDQLIQRVSQFVDVGNVKLSGDLNGKLAWQTGDSNTTAVAAAQPIQLVGEFQIDQPKIQLPGMAAWQRPQLTTRVSAMGQTDSNQVVQLQQGGLQIDIGSEQAIVTLAEPVADAFASSTWKLNTQLSGSTGGWLEHAKNFVDLGDIQARGQLEAQAIAHVGSTAIEIHDAQYSVQQLGFDGYGLTIDEQQTNGTMNARYDLVSGQLLIVDTSLSSNSVSLGGQQITVDVADNVQINGDVAFRADMNRIADWLSLSPTRDSVFWFGDGEGTVRFASNANGIGAQVSTKIQDLIAATRQADANRNFENQGSAMQTVSNSTPWLELWREASVDVSGALNMSNDFESVSFQDVTVQSTTLNANVTGQIDELSGQMLADLRGNWAPDWRKLQTLLAAYTGGAVQMSGQGNYPISVRGPLFETAATTPGSWVSPLLAAATSFDWQQASVAGMPIGAGRVDVDLKQSIASINTGDIPFSQGVIRLQPQVDLRGEQPVMYLPEGTVIDRVALTPETARSWLKFVAPLAADATSAQGSFSLTTKGAQVPLMDPMKMRAEGELKLSNVVIGAGPTAEKLIATAQQLRTMLDPGAAANSRDLKTWLTLEEQTVPVAVQDGRVFHEGIKISHKDLVVRTRGSVGLDQTLDLVAEIPIADDWIEGKKHFASLQGQTISIPVRGTASAPKLDTAALNKISTQLIQQAAGAEINKFIGNKVAPKVTEYQQELNSKIGSEVNKLQNKLQQKLQQKVGDQLKDQAEDQLKGELLKGLGNLFGN